MSHEQHLYFRYEKGSESFYRKIVRVSGTNPSWQVRAVLHVYVRSTGSWYKQERGDNDFVVSLLRNEFLHLFSQ